MTADSPAWGKRTCTQTRTITGQAVTHMAAP